MTAPAVHFAAVLLVQLLTSFHHISMTVFQAIGVLPVTMAIFCPQLNSSKGKPINQPFVDYTSLND